MSPAVGAWYRRPRGWTVVSPAVLAAKAPSGILAKARFWLDHGNKAMNERQREMINLLLDAGQVVSMPA